MCYLLPVRQPWHWVWTTDLKPSNVKEAYKGPRLELPCNNLGFSVFLKDTWTERASPAVGEQSTHSHSYIPGASCTSSSPGAPYVSLSPLHHACVHSLMETSVSKKKNRINWQGDIREQQSPYRKKSGWMDGTTKCHHRQDHFSFTVSNRETTLVL